MNTSVFFVAMLFTGIAMGSEVQKEPFQIPKSPKGQSTKLIDAIKNNEDIPKIKAILEAGPDTLNAIDSMGRTALSWAFSKDDDNHFRLAIFLLGQQCMDVNAGRGLGRPVFIILDRREGGHNKQRDIDSLLASQVDLSDAAIYCHALLSGLSPEFLDSLVAKKGLKKCTHAGHRLLTPAVARSQSARKFFPDEDEKTPYKNKKEKNKTS